MEEYILKYTCILLYCITHRYKHRGKRWNEYKHV